jgi:hypothetical protein
MKYLRLYLDVKWNQNSCHRWTRPQARNVRPFAKLDEALDG